MYLNHKSENIAYLKIENVYKIILWGMMKKKKKIRLLPHLEKNYYQMAVDSKDLKLKEKTV